MIALSSPVRRLLPIAIVVAVGLLCAAELEMLWINTSAIDFTPLRHAATAMWNGRSIYSDPTFVYPPFAAFAMTPLALGSVESAWVGWLVVNGLGLILAVRLIATAGPVRRPAVTTLAVVVLVGGNAAGDSLWLGNMSVLLVPVAVGVVVACGRDRWALGCGLLVLSLLLKPLLAPLVLVPILCHRIRELVAPAVAAGGVVVACWLWVPGSDSFVRVLRYCVGATNLHGLNVVNNLSVSGWAESRQLPSWPPVAASTVIVLATAAALARGRRAATPAVLAGLIFAATLLAGPISEVHYLLVLGALALVALAETRRLADANFLVPGLVMLALPPTARDLVVDPGLSRQTWFLAAQLLLFAGFWRLTWTAPRRDRVAERAHVLAA